MTRWRASEARYVAARIFELELGEGPRGGFDAAHLKAVHRHLFQDVYEWAGHTRDERVPLSDGTVASEPVLRKPDGKPFLPGGQIQAALDRIAGGLFIAHPAVAVRLPAVRLRRNRFS